MERVTSKLFLSNVSNFIGSKTGGTNHTFFLHEYEKIEPRPRGYMPTTEDPWCAIFVSAMWEYLGPNKWFPYECSCTKMIEKLKVEGRFAFPNNIHDSSELKSGWLIFYDWERDGSPDHVGFIEGIKAGTITTIEGNYRNQVWNGQLDYGDKRIYGYGILEYNDDAPTEFEAAKEYMLSRDLMKGDGTDDYWTTPPTREQLAVILCRFRKYMDS